MIEVYVSIHNFLSYLKMFLFTFIAMGSFSESSRQERKGVYTSECFSDVCVQNRDARAEISHSSKESKVWKKACKIDNKSQCNETALVNEWPTDYKDIKYEGTLSKWTNYANGYKLRWFVLEHGVLSYYKNRSEYPNNCRGSIKVLNSNILLNINGDKFKFDIISSASAHTVRYHLKAENIQSLNYWLISFQQVKNVGFQHNRLSEGSEMSECQKCEESVDETKRNPVDSSDSENKDLHADRKLLKAIKNHKKYVSLLKEMRHILEHRLDVSGSENIIERLQEILFVIMNREKYWLRKSDVFQEEIKGLVIFVQQCLISNNKLENLIVDETKSTKGLLKKLDIVDRGLRNEGGVSGSESCCSDTSMESSLPYDGSESKNPNDLSDNNSVMDEFFDACEDFDGSSSYFIDREKNMTLSSCSEDEIIKESVEQYVENKCIYYTGKSTSLDLWKDIIQESFCGYPENFRDALPCDASADASNVSILTVLRSAIGKDLTRISIPIEYNEPLSMLQRMSEDIEYSNLLDMANTEKDPLIRIQYIASFAISSYSSTENRVSKPFNPLLYETFELVSREKQCRYISEQVSHHPPISVCYCEGAKWRYWSEVDVKIGFWGKSIEIVPEGVSHVYLTDTGEHFSWKKVKSVVNNIIIGKLWLDHYGKTTIVNHLTGDRCEVEFSRRNSRDSPKKIEGKVFDKEKRLSYKVVGDWNSSLKSIPIGGDGDEFILWTANERPPCSERMYNFTRFSMVLNEIGGSMEDVMCPTDSRFRPDQRCMENGDIQESSRLKYALETKQRNSQKTKEKRSRIYDIKKNIEDHSPRWFHREIDKDTNRPHWIYKGGYWEKRKTASWSDSKNIFD